MMSREIISHSSSPRSSNETIESISSQSPTRSLNEPRVLIAPTQISYGAWYNELWNQREHELFVMGLVRYGKGRWTKIAKDFVRTKTPQQVRRYAASFLMREPSLTFSPPSLPPPSSSSSPSPPLLSVSSLLPLQPPPPPSPSPPLLSVPSLLPLQPPPPSSPPPQLSLPPTYSDGFRRRNPPCSAPYVMSSNWNMVGPFSSYFMPMMVNQSQEHLTHVPNNAPFILVPSYGETSTSINTNTIMNDIINVDEEIPSTSINASVSANEEIDLELRLGPRK